jgi:nucleoside-diphosphate-sugar epimerase
MKKVLITGGAGFIGYHLAKRLAEQKYNITLVDNFFRSEYDADLATLLARPNVQLIKADLTRPESWKKVGSGYDYVYHFASINGTRLFYEIPHEVLRIGVMTTINVLEWFSTKNKKKDAKILYTSSNEAYAGALESFKKLPLPTPEKVPLVISDTDNPRWSYGGQKLIGELFFIHYAKAYNFRMSIVRPHNFYGPREGYAHIIPDIITRVINRVDPFPIYGADNTRDFCYINDAIEAIKKVMESEKTDGGTYNIGSQKEVRIKDLVEIIFDIMQWRPKKILNENPPAGSVKRRLADAAKIKKDTGWEAATPLREGLATMVEWYIHNPKK